MFLLTVLEVSGLSRWVLFRVSNAVPVRWCLGLETSQRLPCSRVWLCQGYYLGLQQVMFARIPMCSLDFLTAWQLAAKREHCKRERTRLLPLVTWSEKPYSFTHAAFHLVEAIHQGLFIFEEKGIRLHFFFKNIISY